jgi:hypothetical protein
MVINVPDAEITYSHYGPCLLTKIKNEEWDITLSEHVTTQILLSYPRIPRNLRNTIKEILGGIE